MEEAKKRLEVFGWGLLGAGLLAVVTFVGNNLDLIELTGLSSELKVIIIAVAGNIVGQITKWINQRWNLEEKIGGIFKKIGGK